MFEKKFNAFETNRRRKPELLTNINTNLYSSSMENMRYLFELILE